MAKAFRFLSRDLLPWVRKWITDLHVSGGYADFLSMKKDQLLIIPYPKSVCFLPGEVSFGASFTIVSVTLAEEAVKVLVGRLNDLNFFVFQDSPEKIEGLKIEFIVDADAGFLYRLALSDAGFTVTAGTSTGFLGAVQTLYQVLWGVRESGRSSLPAMMIEDEPDFSWRGMHLDCARHFMPMEFVFKFIDLLSLFKFNVFHWHLTDDQGWRVEIRRLPHLTEVGARRKRTLIGHQVNQPYPRAYSDRLHEGFYSQNDIRSVVDYANRRGIQVVPEIEMPGHAAAAIAADPHLSCRKLPIEVPPEWGVWRHVFCPGSSHVYATLEMVLDEVCSLFPDSVVHLGGDECPVDYWRECPACQALMLRERLASEKDLHGHFLRHFSHFLDSKGKTVAGWDEILEIGRLPAGTLVCCWRGEAKVMEAARRGFATINAISSSTYFDRYQTESPAQEPLTFGGTLTLENVWDYSPIPRLLEEDFQDRILGGQGQIWSEYMDTPQAVEWQILPRMLALAESLWRKKKLPYSDFLLRAKAMDPLLRELGYTPSPYF